MLNERSSLQGRPDGAATTEVGVVDVTVRYGPVAAVSRISLTVAPGELFALLGPSGSGKSTLLRAIAGFVRPTGGEILLNGRPVTSLPPYRRNIAMVFQNYALFPHLSVLRNVAFGLEVRGVPRQEVERRVSETLELVRLTGLEERRPHELSGGQQQRVALARALVTRPQVLLLDEPLAALDRKLRVEMQVELRQIHRYTRVTTIYVTHDQEEALSLADRLAILKDGALVQMGPPRRVYNHPDSPFAADFLGASNLLEGVATHVAGGIRVETKVGPVLSSSDAPEPVDGRPVMVSVKPEQITIGDAGGEQPNAYRGIVQSVVYNGPITLYVVRLRGDIDVRVLALSGASEAHEVGRDVRVSWPVSAARIVRPPE